MPSPPPTLRDVAVAAGVHFTTAARALRGSRHVSKENTRRIRIIAERLGYRPNPMVSALMSQKRARRPTSHAGTIAVIDAWRKGSGQDRSYWRTEFKGAQVRAEELGFSLETFSYFAQSPTRLNRILKTRGFTGLLVMPVDTKVTLELDWKDFAAAAIGYSLQTPDLHRAAPDFAQNTVLLLNRLHAAGYRRIGYCGIWRILERTGNRSLEAWAGWSLLNEGAINIPPLLVEKNAVNHIGRWVRKYRPEAVISSGIGIYWELQVAGIEVPKEVLPAAISLHDPIEPSCTGVDQRLDLLGRNAIDLIAGQLNRNERGLPDTPKLILHSGVFHAGTMRDKLSGRRER